MSVNAGDVFYKGRSNEVVWILGTRTKNYGTRVEVVGISAHVNSKGKAIMNKFCDDPDHLMRAYSFFRNSTTPSSFIRVILKMAQNRGIQSPDVDHIFESGASVPERGKGRARRSTVKAFDFLIPKKSSEYMFDRWVVAPLDMFDGDKGNEFSDSDFRWLTLKNEPRGYCVDIITGEELTSHFNRADIYTQNLRMVRKGLVKNVKDFSEVDL